MKRYSMLWKIFLFGLQIINRIKRHIIQGTILILRAYQILVSPLFGPVCRFTPSCSQYAIDALTKYGMIKGLWLAVNRLLRCHPWNNGGYDPVP
jgi:uncharacterized protein